MAKKRAVAYIRVSTASEAQMHSFEFQLNYWQDKINENPECEYVGIYADKGISGKSLNKRPQMLKMLEDARQHKFDIVYTKSVARLARNTEDLLQTVRELRELGIKVLFEKEAIDTFNPTAETMLVLAASVAENELKIYSDNMRWSIRHRYKNGWISVGNGLLGYTMDKETNELTVVPSEAETVRRIYELYLQGYGLAPIAAILTQEKRTNRRGDTEWTVPAIRYILRNEKYKGCSLCQKRVVELGVFRENDNIAPKFYMENTHEAIITPEDYDRVQEEFLRRTSPKILGSTIPSYVFTRKVICGCCGKRYAHKIRNCNKPWRSEIWMCVERNKYGSKKCANIAIKDEVLKAKFIECFNEFVESHRENDTLIALKKKLAMLVDDERNLQRLDINRLISHEDYTAEYAKIRKEIASVTEQIGEQEVRGVTKADYETITEFDETKVEKFIDKVTVYPTVVAFTFINGVTISREYNNGPSGNQKGWRDKQQARIENKTEVQNADSK